MRRPSVVLLLLLGALISACKSDTTSVRIAVHYEKAWGLSRFDVKLGSKATTTPVGKSIRLLVPDALAGQTVPVDVVGLVGETRWAHGVVQATFVRGHEVKVDVTLARLPCGAWCTAGQTACSGDGTITCVEGVDGCFAWGPPSACPTSTPYCSLGVCGDKCVDECATGEKRCDGPGTVKVCGQGDTDTCNDWLPSTACAAGEVCSNGACAKTCTDECTAGAVACLGSGVITCGDLDDDGCLEWSPIAVCGAGTFCSGGTCQASCTDECTVSSCNGLSLSACGQYDLDPCLDLSPGVSCASTDPCVAGACISGACMTAPKVCTSPPAAYCVDASTQRVYDAAGMCMSGDCDYPYKDTACANGCDAGACKGGNSCSGVVCTTPPAPTCTNASTLRTYTSPGTCGGGTCSYAPTDTTCASGCSNGGCTAGPVTWSVQNSGVTTEILHDVWGTSSKDVYVGGEKGVMLHTTDAGTTWTKQAFGSSEAVLGIWGSSATDVFAVGGNGMIRHTSDGGLTWTARTSGTVKSFVSIWGSGPSDIYAAGVGNLRHSTDGGFTWTVQVAGGSTNDNSSLWGSGVDDVYLVSFTFSTTKRDVFHTTDQGATWTKIPTPLFQSGLIWGFNRNDVYVAGQYDLVPSGTDLYDAFAHTTDQGQQWTTHADPQSAADASRAIWGSATNNMYIAGYDGLVKRTADGGVTWTRETIPTTESFVAIWGSGANDIYVVGFNGVIVHGK